MVKYEVYPETKFRLLPVFLADVREKKAPRIHAPTLLKVDRITRKNIRLEILAVSFTIPIGQQAVQGYSFARHRVRGIHPDPEIRIRAVQIPVVPDVRFLGVIFDRRLTFLPHILQLRKSACRLSTRLRFYHRSQYSRYSAIYTDGSKRADYVGCGVVIEDIMHGYRLDTSCSIFTAEAVAIYRALQLIDSTMPRKYCIYTDSMSVLELLENYNDRCHPVVCKILDITSRLYSKGLDIVFCWLPSHVGIIGNEQADSAAKSATTHLPLAVPLSDMKRVIMHHIFKIWQESWSQQLDNKLHSVKPVIGAWSVMPMRRTDVKLTRLRIGHTCFTHWHLLLGEDAPACPSCKVSYTVRHILIDCPVFNNFRITFFTSLHLTLPDLVGEIPHQNLFAFTRRLGFLYLI
ncbi:RNase H domain-containing protein [Trichonephila clavipes]|uniref:RNase H domain-containing protein n=1 Tax=Trichonephila clavipes TaxID=2585209 RepID=A0A8X6VKG7_TRICX|nr:RNase H domain-containing protein [Trichonephila clavipes]